MPVVIEFLNALIIAYGLVFIAEIGDKTQLIILTLAMKGYSSKSLSFGAILGFGIIVFLGGLISILLSKFIKIIILNLVSGIFFIIVGLLQIVALLKKSKGRETNSKNSGKINGAQNEMVEKSRNAAIMGFFSIITMEMGDKTQIMTIVLASTSSSVIGTLLGSWLALSSLALIGAFSGVWLTKRISKNKIDWIGACLFLGIGILILIDMFFI
ncbi:MAG: TMEM165/GDT1 family protein [Promethearchaeota archaeon]